MHDIKYFIRIISALGMIYDIFFLFRYFIFQIGIKKIAAAITNKMDKPSGAIHQIAYRYNLEVRADVDTFKCKYVY